MESMAIDIEDTASKSPKRAEHFGDDAAQSHRTVIARGWTILLDYLDPEPILDCFIEDEIFSVREIRDISELHLTTDKTRKLLEKIRSKGGHEYALLKGYLIRSNQILLAHFIEQIEKGEDTTEIEVKLKDVYKMALKKKEATNEGWKLMVHLNRAEQQGMECNTNALILEIVTQGQTPDITLKINGKVFETTQRLVNENSEESDLNVAGDIGNRRLKYAVTQLLGIIRIAGVKIYNVLWGSTLLEIRCSSCLAMYRLIAIVNGIEFERRLLRVRKCLREDTKEKVKIYAFITSESLRAVQNQLRGQGIIEETGDFTCDTHPRKQIELYCSEHDTFCCSTCVETEHSLCSTLRQISFGTISPAEPRDEKSSLMKSSDTISPAEPHDEKSYFKKVSGMISQTEVPGLPGGLAAPPIAAVAGLAASPGAVAAGAIVGVLREAVLRSPAGFLIGSLFGIAGADLTAHAHPLGILSKESDDLIKVTVKLVIPNLDVEKKWGFFGADQPKAGQSEVYVKFDKLKLEVNAYVTNKAKTTKYFYKVNKLPGEIDPDKCQVEYKKNQIILTLVKQEPTSWATMLSENGLDQAPSE